MIRKYSFSFCVATHNSQAFIDRTLTSILKQTAPDFEVVVVDDHSTDGTVDAVWKRYCSKDSRFKLHANATDPGRPYVDAHNLSYAYANGDMLVRLDHDDVLAEGYLEGMKKFIEENEEYDAYSCANAIVRPDGNVDLGHVIMCVEIGSLFNASYQDSAALWYYHHNLFSNSGSIIRRKFLVDNGLGYKFYELGDHLFWRSFLAEGGRAAVNCERLCTRYTGIGNLGESPCFDFITPDSYEYNRKNECRIMSKVESGGKELASKELVDKWGGYDMRMLSAALDRLAVECGLGGINQKEKRNYGTTE